MKDTQDLVTQLRDQAAQIHDGAPWCLESKAADEIERLRAENKMLAEFATKTSDEKMLLLRELKDAE